MSFTQTASGRLLDSLLRNGSMSRAEATLDTQLARSAIGVAVEDLSRLDLIRTFPAVMKPGVAGRPSPRLEINPTGGHVIAVNVRADVIELATIDLSRNIILRVERSFNVREMSPQQALLTIAQHIREIAPSGGKSPLCGVGIALPGIVGRDNAMARNILALNWHEVPVVSVLEKHIGSQVSITIGHDATLGALAEYRCGAGMGAVRLLFLSAEPDGLGSAMISRGRSGSSPGDHLLQAGHLSVYPSGIPCACGSRGCLELFISGRAIAKTVGISENGSVSDIHSGFSSMTERERSRFLRSDCVKALKMGLVSLINTLAPDRVVLTGALAPIAMFFPSVLNEALTMSVVARAEPVTIVSGALDNAILIGAAEVAFERLRQDPTVVLRHRADVELQQLVVGEAKSADGCT